MPTLIATLKTAQSDFSDIQISSPDEAPYLRSPPTLSFVSLVNYRLIPLYLISNGPYPVYSDNDATEAFFVRSLVQEHLNLGLLAKFTDLTADIYIVFYVDEESRGIKCLCLDFGVLSQLNQYKSLIKGEENVYFISRSRLAPYKSDTSVFDRVLENKTTRKSIPTPTDEEVHLASSLQLRTPAQISQAINKLILLGLRLRGLTVSGLSSSKDKIAIREIHQMTKKASMFAVRKFHYDFNAALRTQDLLLSDLQNIVESLLQTFVDIPSVISNNL